MKLLFAPVLLLAFTTHAAPSDPFQRHLDAAIRAYQAASYQDALAAFEAAYAARPLPRLLINVGKCQRRLGRPEAALDAYRRYLEVAPRPDDQTRRALDEAIAQARTLKADQDAASAGKPSQPAPASPAVKPTTPGGAAAAWSLVESPTVKNLRAIGGVEASDLWASGDDGTLLHFDGSDWTSWSGRWGGTLKSVWGRGRDDVWAVGEHDTVLHWDGRRWSAVPTGSKGAFIGAFGPPGETRLLGDTGELLRREVAGWSTLPVDLGERLRLTRLWRDGKTLWAVGKQGAVLRFDGAVWRNVLSGTAIDLCAVWSKGPRDVWIGGMDSTGKSALTHFDGKTWKTADAPPNVNVYSLWGSGARDVWAAGNRCLPNQNCKGMLLHFDGKAWSTSVESVPAYSISALWGSGPTDVWATGGGRFYHFDGTSWITLPRGAWSHLEDLWGTSPADVWAVGAGGAIWHFDGTSWSNVADIGTERLDGIWAAARDDVWVSGLQGTLMRWNGSSWSSADRERGQVRGDEWRTPLRWRTSLWGASRNDVWLLGSGDSVGAIFHWDGRAWTVSEKDNSHQLGKVWGVDATELWAVALDGSIFRGDGRKWAPVRSGTDQWLLDVWGSGPGDIWAMGNWGHVLHWDGTKWTPGQSGAKGHLKAVRGSGPAEVWAVGDSVAAHWNGRAWSPVEIGGNYALNALWVGTRGEVWAVGDGGTILHRPPR